MNLFGRPNMGIENGRLKSCPDSPNCVCSQDMTELHQIEPVEYDGSGQTAMQRLKAIVEQMPRAQVMEASPNYIHATFTSALFRFVDDVEFLLDETQSVIQVRSCSRVGYSDLGVNRRRVESIRSEFKAGRE